MASHNYAEPTTKEASQILADLQQVKLFHLDVTPADESYWGYRGMDIDQLEYSESRVNSLAAEALFGEADVVHEVNFGNGWQGWCFQIGNTYVWLAPVQEWKLARELERRAKDAAKLPPITNPLRDELEKL